MGAVGWRTFAEESRWAAEMIQSVHGLVARAGKGMVSRYAQSLRKHEPNGDRVERRGFVDGGEAGIPQVDMAHIGNRLCGGSLPQEE